MQMLLKYSCFENNTSKVAKTLSFFKMSKGKAWVNAASQQTLLLSLAPYPIQSCREVT